ncbi:MAG: class I SAM-dependent methyltransferase [Caulobacteraceae bacterium]
MVIGKTKLASTVQKESFEWGQETAETYHARAAQDMDWQWQNFYRPFSDKYHPDLSAVADFAAGYGRNTRKLLEFGAKHVTMIDVNPDCVRALQKSLAGKAASAVLNNGYDLSNLKAGSFTFFYSFDAMVHFDAELIISYIPEIHRVLAPGGLAFLHHSNFTGSPGADFRNNPHWRNYMSANIFQHFAIRAGFDVLEQRVIDWGIPNLDCISVLRRP